MKNADIKNILNNMFKDYEYDQEQNGSDRSGELEVLKMATAKFSSPWKDINTKIPSKTGRYICVITPKTTSRGKTPAFIFDILYYGITGEDNSSNCCFHKWDNNMTYCYKPTVVAWMPIPYYFAGTTVAEEDKPKMEEDADVIEESNDSQ